MFFTLLILDSDTPFYTELELNKSTTFIIWLPHGIGSLQKVSCFYSSLWVWNFYFIPLFRNRTIKWINEDIFLIIVSHLKLFFNEIDLFAFQYKIIKKIWKSNYNLLREKLSASSVRIFQWIITEFVRCKHKLFQEDFCCYKRQWTKTNKNKYINKC